jgi:multidrug efflux pump subunit AcrA (membrane-fusion protein)
MVSDDLLKRLTISGNNRATIFCIPIEHEARDRIEALQAQLAERDKACAEWAEVSQRNYQRAKAAEAQLAKAREALEHAKNNMPHPDQMIDDAIALLNTPTPAPSPDDLVRAALEWAAKQIECNCRWGVCEYPSKCPENDVAELLDAATDPATVAEIVGRAGK